MKEGSRCAKATYRYFDKVSLPPFGISQVQPQRNEMHQKGCNSALNPGKGCLTGKQMKCMKSHHMGHLTLSLEALGHSPQDR